MLEPGAVMHDGEGSVSDYLQRAAAEAHARGFTAKGFAELTTIVWKRVEDEKVQARLLAKQPMRARGGR